MIINDLNEAIKKVEDKAYLFETDAELEQFVSDVVAITAEYAAAEYAALYLYEPDSGELVFRTGIDGVQNGRRHEGGKRTHSALDEDEIDMAFSDRDVVRSGLAGRDKKSGSRVLIPLQRGTQRLGVLVLAHGDKNHFDSYADVDLREISSKIVAMMENASVLLRTRSESHEAVRGVPASAGIAVGTALPFEASMEKSVSVEEESLGPERSLARFDISLSRSLEQLERLQDEADNLIDDMVTLIFSAHLLMLKDEGFTGKMRTLIADGMQASDSIRTVVNEYAHRFSQVKEARIAEKAQEVRDLGYRLIKNLSDEADRGFDYGGQIVIARHIFPSDLVRMAVQNVSGIVLLGSAVTAHLTILARSLSLPVLIMQDKSLLDLEAGTPLLLDADAGTLYIRPGAGIMRTHRPRRGPKKAASFDSTAAGLTRDRVKVDVMANVNLLKDAIEASEKGADGIGLYRSEFPFILWNDFLSEEQQYGIYRRIVTSMPDRPVVLRTADIGGDKLMQGRNEESNPFLGVRGIRFSLANREMFREQIRAMLRAGYDADLGIMLPMVSSVEEVLEAKQEIHRSLELLSEQGIPHNAEPKLGAMIELPAAAIAVEDLAKETDFLSIGTNDLTMYLLAVDRTNENLSHLYRGHHPTVLRTLAQITEGAGSGVSEISVCGDSASDPILIPFLFGIGVRKLSVAPEKIPAVKKYLGRFDVSTAEGIAAEMLSIRKISAMDTYLAEFRKKFPVDMIREG